MNISQALSDGIEILKHAHIEAPAVEAGVLLCHAVNCDRAFLYAHGDFEMSETQTRLFSGMISKRVQYMPRQYITGHQEFMSLDFIVNQDVLIPRHDTETLVESVIDRYRCFQEGRPPRILDIGTGSGCIAVSLAFYIKECRVTAVDISGKVLETARRNAVKSGVADRVTFVCGNLFEGLEGQAFDIIVSNPPYIPSGQIASLQNEIKDFEPLTALDGGSDGLEFYRIIAKNSVHYLKSGGLLALEAGYGKAGEIRALMEESYENINFIKDLSGIERVVTGLSKAFLKV